MFHRSKVSPVAQVDVHDGEDAPPTPPPRGATTKTLLKLALFYTLAIAFMGAHLAMSIHLDNTPVERTRISQNWQSAIANFLALTAELMLVSGVGVAYDQILQHTFSRKTLASDVIDKLVTLPSAPWDLVRVRLFPASKMLWTVSLACVCLPLAGMFPPGTMTVKFANAVLDTRLEGVQTMNISDWGSDIRGFIDKGLFNTNADLYMGNPSPELTNLARSVLAQGRPIDPPTPCKGPCSYDLQLLGPRINCNESKSQAAALFTPCTLTMFETSHNMTKADGPTNNFTTSWHTEFSLRSDRSEYCRNSTLRTLSCTWSLANYDVNIRNEENGTSTFTTKILDDQEFWSEDEGIPTGYYDYFLSSGQTTETLDVPLNQSQLTKDFTHSQAYTIAFAAAEALRGKVGVQLDGSGDYFAAFFEPEDTNAVASPYIGMTNQYQPRIHMSAATLQQYVQDLLISTISLNPRASPLWLNDGAVATMEGGQVYFFDSKLQFFVPYGACLFTVAVIYALGIRALLGNGVPAGRNFEQFATPVDDGSPTDEYSDKKGDDRYDVDEKMVSAH